MGEGKGMGEEQRWEEIQEVGKEQGARINRNWKKDRYWKRITEWERKQGKDKTGNGGDQGIGDEKEM
jgi:hypothetical protein